MSQKKEFLLKKGVPGSLVEDSASRHAFQQNHASNKRAWVEILWKIKRVTCENVRVQLQKAKKINRRGTIIWEARVCIYVCV